MSREIGANTSIPEYPIKPVRPLPGFIRSMRAHATQHGVNQAVAHVFQRANIKIHTDSVGHSLTHPEVGTILVGDHRNTVEKWPLLAWLGVTTDKDCHFMSKPFSLQARLLHSLGEKATHLTLPVMPRALAKERASEPVKDDRLWRFRNRHQLPTTEEIRANNSAAMRRTTGILAVGGLVTIFPTGSTADALTAPWQRGLGSIIQQLPEERREQVHVLPFRFADFSAGALVRALSLREFGITPAEQTITLHVGESRPVGSILADVQAEHGTVAPQLISDAIRTQYVRDFSPEV